jgi:hypothetical protein
MTKAIFKSEAELCRAFISQLPKGWTAYAESCNFDIVLAHADGTQIGIEAKLTLNAKVILQAVDRTTKYREKGPDFRAVLVPAGTAGHEMKAIAKLLGLTTIEMKSKELYLETKRKYMENDKFTPHLPLDPRTAWRANDYWIDCAPIDRLKLPEYVPDVTAGASAPSQLSEWKIKAIKICVLLEKIGYVTPMDFAEIGIDRGRFVTMGWIKMNPEKRGHYLPGFCALDLRRVHPRNYVEIEAHFEKWRPKKGIPQTVLTIEGDVV